MRKCVRWSTITVYEFGVGIGGSAVPRHGGPAVGLAGAPECVWSTSVDAVSGPLRTPAPAPEAPTQSATATQSAMATSTATHKSRERRRRRVRWLKPLERVNMLEKAGCSEKRIYQMLMESSSIAQSRRLCLRIPVKRTPPVL